MTWEQKIGWARTIRTFIERIQSPTCYRYTIAQQKTGPCCPSRADTACSSDRNATPTSNKEMEEEHKIELSTFRSVGCSKPVASLSHVLPNGGLVDESNAPVSLRASGFKPDCRPFGGTILKIGGWRRIRTLTSLSTRRFSKPFRLPFRHPSDETYAFNNFFARWKPRPNKKPITTNIPSCTNGLTGSLPCDEICRQKNFRDSPALESSCMCLHQLRPRMP